MLHTSRHRSGLFPRNSPAKQACFVVPRRRGGTGHLPESKIYALGLSIGATEHTCSAQCAKKGLCKHPWPGGIPAIPTERTSHPPGSATEP